MTIRVPDCRAAYEVQPALARFRGLAGAAHRRGPVVGSSLGAVGPSWGRPLAGVVRDGGG
jgi:hypothetical protein